MPDVSKNFSVWNNSYVWEQQGEEWSKSWGGAESQWFGCIFPRIHSFLPVNSILEIAPGYGRWTQFLKEYCKRLTAVDLSEKCIEVCKQRFQNSDNHKKRRWYNPKRLIKKFEMLKVSHYNYQRCKKFNFYVNNGYSLSMIQNKIWDFVFSFDSLVHAEADVLESYISQLSQKLSCNGVAFLHHSNLLRFPNLATTAPNMDSHWRAPSVSADLVKKYVELNGMLCLSQELINWGCLDLIDCFTLISLPGSRYARSYQILENPNFMLEASLIKQLNPLYSDYVKQL